MDCIVPFRIICWHRLRYWPVISILTQWLKGCILVGLRLHFGCCRIWIKRLYGTFGLLGEILLLPEHVVLHIIGRGQREWARMDYVLFIQVFRWALAYNIIAELRYVIDPYWGMLYNAFEYWKLTITIMCYLCFFFLSFHSISCRCVDSCVACIREDSFCLFHKYVVCIIILRCVFSFILYCLMLLSLALGGGIFDPTFLRFDASFEERLYL